MTQETMIDATEEHDSWNGGTYTSTSIKRVDNRTELD